jgi:hypothetical protein
MKGFVRVEREEEGRAFHYDIPGEVSWTINGENISVELVTEAVNDPRGPAYQRLSIYRITSGPTQ